jgi:hypothetical protein
MVGFFSFAFDDAWTSEFPRSAKIITVSVRTRNFLRHVVKRTNSEQLNGPTIGPWSNSREQMLQVVIEVFEA